MARNLNDCKFIGRLGKPVELKYLPSGGAVANFSIACSDDYKDKDGNKVEKTNWINCVAFGKPAELIAQYCDKGSKLFVSGKHETRKWQDNDGNDRYTTEINVRDFEFLDSKSEGQQSTQQQSQPQRSQQQAQGHKSPHGHQYNNGFQPASDGFDVGSDIPFMRINDRLLNAI